MMGVGFLSLIHEAARPRKRSTASAILAPDEMQSPTDTPPR